MSPHCADASRELLASLQPSVCSQHLTRHPKQHKLFLQQRRVNTNISWKLSVTESFMELHGCVVTQRGKNADSYLRWKLTSQLNVSRFTRMLMIRMLKCLNISELISACGRKRKRFGQGNRPQSRCPRDLGGRVNEDEIINKTDAAQAQILILKHYLNERTTSPPWTW